MIRILAALAALLVVAGMTRAEQDRPASKKADVVKELQRDFDEARAGLQQDDAGAKTRAAHRRIIDGLDELLKVEEDQSNAGSSANPPGLKPQEPAGAESRQPKGSTQPMPKLNPMAEPKSIPDLTPAPQGKAPALPGVGPDGPWDLPARRRQESVDAVGRERFPPRYEELLRAYYRSLAAGRGDEE